MRAGCASVAASGAAAVLLSGCVDLSGPNGLADAGQSDGRDGPSGQDAPLDPSLGDTLAGDPGDAPGADAPASDATGEDAVGDASPPRANGQACVSAAECKSGICADGVCCATSCAGPCRSCARSGSEGACVALDAGAVCGPASCAAGTWAQESTCDGSGGCKPGLVIPCEPYVCKDGSSCRASCTDSAQCAAGRSCTTGSCGPKPSGLPCAAPAECSSGLCVDGTCCGSDCTTNCLSCDRPGSRGSCAPVGRGETDGTCTGTSACDGGGACRAALGRTCSAPSECASGHCADRVCCESACAETCRTCDVGGGTAGKCILVARGSGDYFPSGACSGGKACDGAGACKIANGKTCTGSGDECVSGFCVDGVCCQGACAGTCFACNLTTTGLCRPIPVHATEDGCSGSMACNGAGACKKATAEPCLAPAECASSACHDGVCCTGLCGTCLRCDAPGSEGTCAPVTSGLPYGACGGSSVCNGMGACKTKLGAPCPGGAASGCVSGFCADGVCCDTECAGGCMTCAASGSAGTCKPAAAGTDPRNKCAVTCDSTACAIGTGLCDGAGACVTSVSCGAFQCTGAGCNSGCTINSHCCGGATARVCMRPDSTLACGASFSESTASGPSHMSGYGACTLQAGSAAGIFSGPERHYRFAAGADTCVTVSLTPTFDADLFAWPEDSVCTLRSGCQGSALAGDSGDKVRFFAATGSKHFIVIDSRTVAGETFTLDVACAPGPC